MEADAREQRGLKLEVPPPRALVAVGRPWCHWHQGRLLLTHRPRSFGGIALQHAHLTWSVKEQLMPRTADEFLNDWTTAYVKSDPRDRGELHEAVAQCLEDGERDGLSRDEVMEAAGGNLAKHLQKAVVGKLT
jgi:hypothetical protein